MIFGAKLRGPWKMTFNFAETGDDDAGDTGDMGGGGGGDETSWRDGLSDELKSDASLVSITDVPSLAKSYVEQRKLVGANTLAVPGKGADAAAWDKVHAALGRPEKSDGYELPTQDLPEGFAASDADQVLFKTFAHNAGMHPRQAAVAFREYAKMAAAGQASQMVAQKAEHDKAIESLQADFGTAFDQNIKIGEKAMADIFGDDFAAMIKDRGLTHNVPLVKGMVKLGQMMMEDEISGHGAGVAFTLSPEQAKKKIAQLESDPEFTRRYLNKQHVGFKEADEEINSLYAMAYPVPV